MATVEECEKALHQLAARMAERDPEDRNRRFDRTLRCQLRDLDTAFTGRLVDGELRDIARAHGSSPKAQIGLDLTSDDLVAMVDGELNLASAWATGRMKVHAGVRDLIRLRTIF